MSGPDSPVRPLRLCLAGAPLDSGNRGVEALALSVLAGIDRWAPGSTVMVFDNGWGVRDLPVQVAPSLQVKGAGVRVSRRWHRPESWTQITLAQNMRLPFNHVAQAIASADAVLDISGGDSFTDLYGTHRFRQVMSPKEAAIRANRPLVLLPQTYGPFSSSPAQEQSAVILRAASAVFARDQRSQQIAQELMLGKSCTLSVDAAFALPPLRPTDLPGDLAAALSKEPATVAGVNVSGLLGPAAAATRYGLSADYLHVMTRVAQGVLDAGLDVVFVPHVRAADGLGESDTLAIDQVRAALHVPEQRRVWTLPDTWSACEYKWVIARCAWFTGARMHATIAALSSRVPVTAVGYSDKTAGVFETCGQAKAVVDARVGSAEDQVAALLNGFRSRALQQQSLDAALPAIIEQSVHQLQPILGALAR